MTAAEWGGAACRSFYVWVPNPTGPAVELTPATLCIMNDVTNVYVGLLFQRTVVDAGNSFVVEFDLDNDGIMEEGDDALVVNPGSVPMLIDDFRSSTLGCSSGGLCGPRDVDWGGTNDGQAAFSNNGMTTFYEVSHPISSGDIRDMDACAGDTIGVTAFLRMIVAGPGLAYPDGFADTDYPAAGQYVELRLAGECSSAAVAPGAALSTDDEGDGATPADPVETTVVSPNAGDVAISEGPAAPSTDGFVVLGQQIRIEAPPATAADPLIFTFTIDASVIPPGTPLSALGVRRNGVLVPDCTGIGATPDPCVASRSFLPDGDAELVIRTSAASLWDVGIVPLVDVTAPTLTVRLSPDALWPPNRTLRSIVAIVEVSDDFDPAPQVTLVSVVSNEGAGGVEPDVFGAELGTDDRAFALRAERSGRAKAGRVYSVTYRATDAAGNTTLVSADVTVPHDRRK
jgi:hypothetical protein